MSIRDVLLPVVSLCRGLVSIPFGLRRFTVTLRRRVWDGSTVGDGTPTNNDIVLFPLPKVRDAFSGEGSGGRAQLEYILQHGQLVKDRFYVISKITPAWAKADGSQGGYTADQLKMEPPEDLSGIEPIVILVGDDGFKRECVQVSVDLDRAFGYTMLVKETDRPTVTLVSIVISQPSATIPTLIATGTFTDGSTSQIEQIVTWSSDNSAIAKIDPIGQMTNVSSGTANINCSLGVIQALPYAYVVP